VANVYKYYVNVLKIKTKKEGSNSYICKYVLYKVVFFEYFKKTEMV
jgi:hypothetical protein